MKIKISKIDDSTFTVREKLDQESFDELKESLKQDGQWNPIQVRQEGTEYQVIAGHRRLHAAKELGWSEIEATVKDVDESEGLILALKTNIVKCDMSEREQGKVLYQLTQNLGISQGQLAKKLGKSRKWVDYRIKIALDLNPEVADALDNGLIKMRIAEVIASLEMDKQPPFMNYLLGNNIHDQVEARKAKRRFLNNTIYTIGYEGKTIGDFISVLLHNKIKYLIDVRFSNESQYKPDFNGNVLKRELERNGIIYLYKPEYGVPYEWQNPYKDGAIPFECLDKFYRWNVKKNTNFQNFLDTVKESGKTVLMCYEQFPVPKKNQKIACHRSILASIMEETKEFQEIVHL